MDVKKLTNQDCLDIMDKFLDSQEDPKVGIFWYDPVRQELFGVRSEFASDILHATTRVLHYQVWAKESNRLRGKGLPLGVWSGSYVDVPRGRVFKEGDGFVIKVGSWIKDYPEAEQLIKEEFDLSDANSYISIDHHWEIGQGYEGDKR
ncbi:MAG: hypothetical protein LBS25_05200 [Candidatus Symbiothrix sp.]|jgi:hypothetical protein|nr:hypothetical protein [Candidatus Symbiothrix sp.]